MIYSGPINDKFLMRLIGCADTDEKLVLNSGGGCIGVMRAALDFLLSAEWVTVATGMCMSAAVPLVAAGSERYATASTRFMIHNGSFDYGILSAKESQAEGAEAVLVQTEYWAAMEKLTKKPGSWWRDQCSGGPLYFSAKQAKLYGVIDRVL